MCNMCLFSDFAGWTQQESPGQLAGLHQEMLHHSPTQQLGLSDEGQRDSHCSTNAWYDDDKDNVDDECERWSLDVFGTVVRTWAL